MNNFQISLVLTYRGLLKLGKSTIKITQCTIIRKKISGQKTIKASTIEQELTTKITR